MFICAIWGQSSRCLLMQLSPFSEIYSLFSTKKKNPIKSPKSSTCKIVVEDFLKLDSDSNACQSCKVGFDVFQE